MKKTTVFVPDCDPSKNFTTQRECRIFEVKTKLEKIISDNCVYDEFFLEDLLEGDTLTSFIELLNEYNQLKNSKE